MSQVARKDGGNDESVDNDSMKSQPEAVLETEQLSHQAAFTFPW